MKRAMTWIFLGAAVAALGCNEEPKGLATPPAGEQAAAPAPIKDEDLAVPADFDDEAEKAITEANYKTELDAIEKEIDSEP
jgi:hypothetical protein